MLASWLATDFVVCVVACGPPGGAIISLPLSIARRLQWFCCALPIRGSTHAERRLRC